MSYTLVANKRKARVPFVGVPSVCCVMDCKKAAVMSRKLRDIRAWASLCEEHYKAEDGLRLDMNKMRSIVKARRWAETV